MEIILFLQIFFDLKLGLSTGGRKQNGKRKIDTVDDRTCDILLWGSIDGSFRGGHNGDK